MAEKPGRSDEDGGKYLVRGPRAGNSRGTSFFLRVAPDEEKQQDFQAEYACRNTRTALSRWGRHLLAVLGTPL